MYRNDAQTKWGNVDIGTRKPKSALGHVHTTCALVSSCTAHCSMRGRSHLGETPWDFPLWNISSSYLTMERTRTYRKVVDEFRVVSRRVFLFTADVLELPFSDRFSLHVLVLDLSTIWEMRKEIRLSWLRGRSDSGWSSPTRSTGIQLLHLSSQI